jgi:prevent-host-death family protein
LRFSHCSAHAVRYLQLDLNIAMYMDYHMVMKIANIAELKNKISEYLAAVENGEEVEVRKRNVPIARIVPLQKPPANNTILGCGRDSGKILGDITEPFVPDGDWEMLGKSPK